MNDEFLGLLGIARRASKLSLGHDAAVTSIKKGKAKLCLLSSDASERLEKEFNYLLENKKIKIIRHDYSMDELNFAISSRAGVLTVDDDGFAQRISEILLRRNDLL
ncbi:MAG: ribosomal L7Ae/L30e/S12e/Gadd45 family protein [Clostridiales bacterium]|nr:ribosomal L7Ae/L30e/S12e/Gadd45 family protein [Clostridiales bacterium]